ncbi:MAG TPA: Glu/Leu/Phe/Val dehydrogenase dimerization domain-containing protein [Acidimicrobiales bacterium]|jgi:leucine dehydrogenase
MSTLTDHVPEVRTERLAVAHDQATGLQAVIAIDDTTRGPGLGGVRWMPYPDLDAAVAEASRLARGMTLKNALAELPYGGAKSVILSPDDGADRTAVLRAFGRVVADLHGTYIPGVDMGTSIEDLAVIGTVVPDVACSHADPSPWTALGVYAGIVATVCHLDHTDLDGHRVVVQGAGHVGSSLALRLADAGADVLVTDLDPERSERVAASVGGRSVEPEEALAIPCDVLAPCAQARVITAANAPILGARIVAGAANDMLSERSCAAELAGAGITYVPDFLLNAGGVIHIHAIRSGWDHQRLGGVVMEIGQRTGKILERAEASGRTPLDIAEEMATDRLGHPASVPL